MGFNGLRPFWPHILLRVLILGIINSCSSLTIDSSTDAFAAGDMTLVNSCQAAPSVGFDSCHFTVGDTVNGSWILMAPPPKKASHVTGGQIDIYYKDLHKSYPIKDWAIPIDFRELFGIQKWDASFDEGVLQALVIINWVDNAGINQITKYRGVALLLVTAPGYDRLAIDSGNAAWGIQCKIEYSTAGRSAMKCK